MNRASINRQNLKIARQLIGAPFHWHQRGPQFDCLGVIIYPLWKTGIIPESFDFKNYGNRPGKDLIPQFDGPGSEWLQRVDRPKHGDILTFYVGKAIAHLGWIDRKNIIHADMRQGVVSVPREDLGLRPAIAYRVKLKR